MKIQLRKIALACIISFGLTACVGTDGPKAVPALELGSVDGLTDSQIRARAEVLGEHFRNNPGDPKTAQAYAQALAALNRHEQRSAVLERAVIVNGESQELLAAYGKSLIAVGEYARADQVLAQALAPDNPDWSVLSARGVANDKLGNHSEARSLYAQALRIKPNEPTVLTNMGLSFAYERNYAESEAYLKKALQQPDVDQRTEQNLAVVLGLQGKTKEEKQSLAKVMSVDAATDTMAGIANLREKQQAEPRQPPSTRSASARRSRVPSKATK